ncbi:MAG: hypothetical protein K1Y36_18675 [Blastocatellia bacterium]|nr:hypothetical protein [Blastocatellia bacterium]
MSYQSFFYDERDKQANRWLVKACLCQALALTLLLGAFTWVVWRKPDRYVIAESPSGRVLVIDGRNTSKADGVLVTEDVPGDADKLYCGYLFTDFTHKYNRTTLTDQLEQASPMLSEAAIKKFGKYLQQSRLIETRLAQSWDSRWELVTQELLPGGPPPAETGDTRLMPQESQPQGTTVRILAGVYLDRLEAGTHLKEKKQVEVFLTMVLDPRGRCLQNRRTGFLITQYMERELKGQSVLFPMDPLRIEEEPHAPQPQ